MTLQEVTQLAALGEGSYLEFKRRVPRDSRIAKELIAFANTHGGRLLLGVDDDGSVVGVRDAAEEEFALERALKGCVSPPIALRLERVPVSRKREVIVVAVAESANKPHFLVVEGEASVAYVRVEDASVEASPEAVDLMRAQEDTNGVTFEFGDREQLLLRYLDRYGRVTVSQFADMTGLPRPNASDTLVRLTRAGVLRLHPGERADFFTLAFAKGE